MPGYLDYPPTPTGDSERDVRALYAYLYQMCETLNVILENMQSDRKEEK